MDGYTIDLSGDYLYAGIEMADTVKRETLEARLVFSEFETRLVFSVGTTRCFSFVSCS